MGKLNLVRTVVMLPPEDHARLVAEATQQHVYLSTYLRMKLCATNAPAPSMDTPKPGAGSAAGHPAKGVKYACPDGLEVDEWDAMSPELRKQASEIVAKEGVDASTLVRPPLAEWYSMTRDQRSAKRTEWMHAWLWTNVDMKLLAEPVGWARADTATRFQWVTDRPLKIGMGLKDRFVPAWHVPDCGRRVHEPDNSAWTAELAETAQAYVDKCNAASTPEEDEDNIILPRQPVAEDIDKLLEDWED